MLGDYTFACDSMDFLGLKPTRDFPAENYIGPILADDLFTQKIKVEDEVEPQENYQCAGHDIDDLGGP